MLSTMNRSLLRAASRHFHSANRTPTIARGLISRNASVRGYATAFNWEDPLAASELYTEEELAIQDTARQYCQDKLQPRVLGVFFTFHFFFVLISFSIGADL